MGYLFKVSWFKFVVFNSLFLTALNFVLFRYIYSNLNFSDNIFMGLALPFIFFGLLGAIFSLLYIPYLVKFISVALIIISACSAYFMYEYGVIIDSDMIRNLAQTDPSEAFSFVNLNLIIYLLFLCLLPCLVVIFTRVEYGTFKRHLAVKFISFLSFLLISVALFFSFSKSITPFFRNYNQARVYNVPFYQIYSVAKYIKKSFFNEKKELVLIAADAVKIDTKNKKLMILIVGETARAANYSLGGYATNDTNFYLKKQPNLIYFPEFYSCGTSTAISLPCMFSKSTIDTYKDSEYQENALDILKRVGVKIVWLGNNSGKCKGVCDRLNSSDIHYFDAGFDGVMLESLKDELKNISDDKLIVLHLQGSHGPTYFQRYPKEFDKFKPTCDTSELSSCSSESIINTYDNTILYTDYLINEIIEMTKNLTDSQNIVWYFSDHGESLGEDGIYLHGMPYFIAPKYQKHIPMIIYSSKDDIYSNLKKEQSKHLSHDNLFSSLLGFFAVFTKDYDKKYDIFSFLNRF